jgi:hypothetical protein
VNIQTFSQFREAVCVPINMEESESLGVVENPQLKAESDLLRRQLMDKKAQIQILEQQSNCYDEVRSSLFRLIQDFQSGTPMTFVNPEQLECPFHELVSAIPLLRSGIERFISRHQCLATRFELEFRRNLIHMEAALKDSECQLVRERSLLKHTRYDKECAKQTVHFLSQAKAALMRTVLMRAAHRERCLQRNRELISESDETLRSAVQKLEECQTVSEALDGNLSAMNAEIQTQRVQSERQGQQHAELVGIAEELWRTLRRESHSHNCSLSALDDARQRLKQLMRMIESYRDNLKTQELLDAEHENRKLHAVINNEKDSLSRAKEAVVNKGKECEEQIGQLSERLEGLRMEIMKAEQKLQTQMVRIPDFAQLRQTLDRLLAKSRKHRDEILQRMYLLEEIRDRNHIADMLEIQESLDRQAQLKALMPLDREIKGESQLPKMLEMCKRYQAEIEDLLNEPGFWDREIGDGS